MGEDELGIQVIFGRARRVYKGGSGGIFIPWLPKRFKCYLKIYPRTLYDLRYPEVTYMSKEGKYHVEATGKDEPCKSVEMKVESQAYLNFPTRPEMLVREDDPNVGVCFLGDLSPRGIAILRRDGRLRYNGVVVVLEKTHPLIKIFRAGVPTDREELQDRTAEAMQSSVRAAGPEMTWREANEVPGAFQDRVRATYLGVDGTLIKMGFRPSGMKPVISLVDPPEEVKKAAADLEAAQDVAERQSVEVGNALTQMVDAEIVAFQRRFPRVPLTEALWREIRTTCLNQLTRERTMKGGGKLTDFRIANADGTSFGKGSLGEIVATIVAAVGAAMAAKSQGDGQRNQNDRDDNDRDNRGGGRSRRRRAPAPAPQPRPT